MKNPEKVMKPVSIIILVCSILYAVGGGLFAVLGILMVAVSGTDDFALALAESLEQTGVSVEMLGEAAQKWNQRLGTNFSIMELMNLMFVIILVMGIGMLLYAVSGMVCAGLGLKAAKGGSAKSAFVWGIILLVCTLIRFGINFGLEMSALLGGLVSFVLPGLYTYLALLLKKRDLP